MTERGPVLICTNCGAKVNPSRVMLGGKRYICINCNMDKSDGELGSSSVGKSVDGNSPNISSRSFQNKTRGNQDSWKSGLGK